MASFDDEVDKLFPGTVAVLNKQAFAALGIKHSYGHELINSGVLERIYVNGGRGSACARSRKSCARAGSGRGRAGDPRRPRLNELP